VGRIVNPEEHDISGEVRVGRSVREGRTLDPELRGRRDQQMRRVQRVKRSATTGNGKATKS
jgi:hypothetical protein